eukprot:10424617-Alexandrium_andersonii.AAC.1
MGAAGPREHSRVFTAFHCMFTAFSRAPRVRGSIHGFSRLFTAFSRLFHGCGFHGCGIFTAFT